MSVPCYYPAWTHNNPCYCSRDYSAPCQKGCTNPKCRETWRRRNDSSEIAKIVAQGEEWADDEFCCCSKFEKSKIGQERLPIISKYHIRCFDVPPKPKMFKTMIKRPTLATHTCPKSKFNNKNTFTNECYCNLSPERPVLYETKNKNPKRRTNKGDIRFKTKLANVYRLPSGQDSPVLPDQNTPNCPTFHAPSTLQRAQDLIDYRPKSEFLRHFQITDFPFECSNSKTKKEPKLKYTKHRQALEEAYKDIENENKHKTKSVFCKNCHHNEIMSGYCESCNEKRSCLSPIDGKKVRNARHIRDENYFETHLTDLTEMTNFKEANVKKVDKKHHKCHHKFTVDERMLPKPLNADVFGISRCTECNKPMDNFMKMHEKQKQMGEHCTCSSPTPRKHSTKVNERSAKSLQRKHHHGNHKSTKSHPSPPNHSMENNLYSLTKLDDSSDENKPQTARFTLQETKQSKSCQSLRNISSKEENCESPIQPQSPRMSARKSKVTSNISPRIISIAGKNDTVTLRIPNVLLAPNDFNLKKCFVPENTWALRYQKGMT